MKITRQQFKEAMQAIKTQREIDQKNAKAIESVFEDAFQASLMYNNYTIVKGLVGLLEVLTRDRDKMIEYFMYERDWGNEGSEPCIKDNVRGVSWTLNSVDELYDYLKFYY